MRKNNGDIMNDPIGDGKKKKENGAQKIIRLKVAWFRGKRKKKNDDDIMTRSVIKKSTRQKRKKTTQKIIRLKSRIIKKKSMKKMTI